MSYAPENHRFASQIRVPHDVFGSMTVVIELPAGAAALPGAAASFILAGNVLCRMFERVHLVAKGLELKQHPWGPQSLDKLVAVLSDLAVGEVLLGPPSHADIAIGIGAPPTVSATRTTFVSFSGWTAALETVLERPEDGVIGPLLAACFGSSQVFLHSAALAGAVYRPMQPFTFSGLTYGETHISVSSNRRLLLPDSHLVGVGAVGSALIYALGHIHAKGTLHAIDDDFVDRTNLQRYILMRSTDVKAAKADVARECLTGSGIDVKSFAGSFQQFAEEHGDQIDLLITPVDSEVGRRELAAYLPRRVLNAATGHTKVTLSSHGFGDGKACLRCLYLPEPTAMTTERRLAGDMGLELDVVEKHLASNLPVSEELVRQVEKHRRLEAGSLADWVGQRLQSLYQRAVCGEAAIQVAGATVVSPLSFISATAGVLLAGELLKLCDDELRRFALDNYFRLDTLARPNSSMRLTKPPDGSGRCICRDAEYVEWYREKYSLAP